ncbi:MAG TPA: glycosyl hydrolase, partial [Chthoniobacteraceae bacterium]|nr:glycosyl hydrolase [Chthoniobacteraceae bacterium]
MKSTILHGRGKSFLLFLSLGLAAFSGHAQQTADPLAAGFALPPPSAKPTVLWHWIDDNVSKEGITADFEHMKRVGIGGVVLAWAHVRVPMGQVKFASSQWFDLVQYAVQEAHRLGLTMEIAPGSGWTAGGGKWIDPAHSMLRLTTTEVH